MNYMRALPHAFLTAPIYNNILCFRLFVCLLHGNRMEDALEKPRKRPELLYLAYCTYWKFQSGTGK